MGALLSPFQLGYGTALGAETAAHSARRYLVNLHPDPQARLQECI